VEIEIDDRWAIMGKIHGGYLLRAMVAPLLTDDHPHPFSVSATFVRSPDGGPATLELDPVRVGRRLSQHRVRLLQGGEVCVDALVTTGKHHGSAEPFWESHTKPSLPDVETCHRAQAELAPGVRIGHLDFVDLRYPSTNAFAGSVEASNGSIAAHGRMADAETTVVDLLLLADAMPPVTLDMGLIGWVPTIELTIHVRDLPAPGWLTLEQRTHLMQDSWIDEECDIWDSRGRLVCQARQLASYRLS
jgi:acyl-CoA thioesterase